MDWTFWLLSGVALLAICAIIWWVLDAYGFLSEGWDEHFFDNGDDK